MKKPVVRWLALLTAALIVLVLAGGCRREGERPTQVASLDAVLAAVPDSAMRQRWRDAAAANQLPDLNTMPVPATPLAQRTRARVPDRALARPVQIPQGTVADVRLGGDTVRAYTGAFVLTDVQAGRLAGRITGRAAPLEIHYKLPGNAVLADARQTGTLTLVLQDDIEGVSLRRKVALLAGRSPLLFWLSDGGDRPYNRVFEELPLRVRQQPPGADSLSAVAITFGRETFMLRRGGRRQARGVDGRVVEFYLLSSYWTRAADVATAEGDAYHVMLLAWRPQG